MHRKPLSHKVLALALAGGLLSALPASAAPDDTARNFGCRASSGEAKSLNIKVDGENATGRYALPAEDPTGVVVFAHGYGHTSLSWVAHMERTARELGVIAVAMDYRGTETTPDSNGDGLPESRGWHVLKGAEDSIAVASAFEASCASIEKVVILGVSMGGNASGLAVALAGERGITKTDGSPLFDYWIDVEGAVNVIETYAGASLLAPANAFAKSAKADIEAEMGGTFEQAPAEYQRRAVVTRMDDIKAAGLDGISVIHGLDDGLVPYNQGREMASLSVANGIPTRMVTVGTKDCASEKETSATSYVGTPLKADYNSPLAGHASEKSTTHIVMRTAFAQLADIAGPDVAFAPYSEEFVNGTDRVSKGYLIQSCP